MTKEELGSSVQTSSPARVRTRKQQEVVLISDWLGIKIYLSNTQHNVLFSIFKFSVSSYSCKMGAKFRHRSIPCSQCIETKISETNKSKYSPRSVTFPCRLPPMRYLQLKLKSIETALISGVISSLTSLFKLVATVPKPPWLQLIMRLLAWS